MSVTREEATISFAARRAAVAAAAVAAAAVAAAATDGSMRVDCACARAPLGVALAPSARRQVRKRQPRAPKASKRLERASGARASDASKKAGKQEEKRIERPRRISFFLLLFY